MNQASSSQFLARITKNLPIVERVFLVGLAVGAILATSHVDTSVLKISLLCLAIVFFLYAYRPLDPDSSDAGEPVGYLGLLALTVIPKVIWISSAVSVVAILFYFMNSNAAGYKQLAIIGGTSIAVALALLLILLATGAKNLRVVYPVVLRAIPLLLSDAYIFFDK
jgi:hypothetical protein